MLTAFSTHVCLQLLLLIVFQCILFHLRTYRTSSVQRHCKGRFTNAIDWLIDYSMDRWHHIKVGLTSSCKSFGVVINTSMTGCGGLSPRRRRRRLFVARSVVLEAPSGQSSSTISPSSSSVSSLTSSLTSSSTSDSLNSLSLSSVAASTFTCV